MFDQRLTQFCLAHYSKRVKAYPILSCSLFHEGQNNHSHKKRSFQSLKLCFSTSSNHAFPLPFIIFQEIAIRNCRFLTWRPIFPFLDPHHSHPVSVDYENNARTNLKNVKIEVISFKTKLVKLPKWEIQVF